MCDVNLDNKAVKHVPLFVLFGFTVNIFLQEQFYKSMTLKLIWLQRVKT